MSADSESLNEKVVLITGSAKRLGAVCARRLHSAGANVLIHYHTSNQSAQTLVDSLNTVRANSAALVGTELGSQAQAEYCIKQALSHWHVLDHVVNNASSFYPTPMGDISDQAVANLLSSNFTAPLFIAQAARTALSSRSGSIVNMIDVHAFKAYPNHSVYCAAKAALAMLTQSLAMELAPQIRVNGIAPGAILWPEDGSMSEAQQQEKLKEIPLGRTGTPEDIADLLLYLCSDSANYLTGEIIKVDGGRSL